MKRTSLLHAFALRLITAVFTTQTLLAAWPAAAQLVPDRTAPSGTRGLVDAAANGVAIVHIAPPSKAGVSRNVYDQFNVPTQGLILNNSKDQVQTQLGGWITGNLQLGLTPARIILNEVSGSSRSELKGTLEVAGQRADIVIANPNGILCDGCGFLNADRATLATGRPVFGADGALTAFDVRQGTVQVGAGGLNATEQQQLDLYARGLVVEGELWAKKLAAVIGANHVLHATLEALPEATPLAATGETPRFAVDVKELGGMFAGRIYLIATDKGLGVNSAGRTASLAGNLQLSTQGDLTLKDTYAAADVQLASAGTVSLTGQTLAQNLVRIDASAQLANSGALQAGRLELRTPRIDNAGSIAQTAPGQNMTLTLPGGLANSGTIYTPGDLSVQASAVGPSTLAASAGNAPSGQLLAGGALQIAADSLDLRGQQLAANGNIAVQANALRIADGGMTAGGNVSVQATGPLDISGTSIAAGSTARLAGSLMAFDRTRVAAAGDVQLAATGAISAATTDISSNASVSIQGASVEWRASTLNAASATLRSEAELKLDGSQLVAGQQIALQGQGISTAAAMVAAPRLALDAGSGALNNAGGQIMASSQAADALAVSATDIGNQGGKLRANGGLALDVGGGLIDNTDGVIAGASGSLSRLAGLVNTRGALYTQSDLALANTALNNAGGTIATTANLAVTTPGQDIDNTGGVLQAGGSITLDAGGAALMNTGGTVSAQAALNVTAGTVATSRGTLAAGQNLRVAAGTLQATGATIGSAGDMSLAVDGAAGFKRATLSAGGQLTLHASDVQAARAKAASGGDLKITVDDLHGGTWATQGDVTAQAQGLLDVSGGGLIAGGSVTATAGQGMVTDGAQVAGRSVSLDAGAGSLSNTGGAIVATATAIQTNGNPALAIAAHGIDNSQGVIASAGDANIDAHGQTVNNTDGVIQAAGTLIMQAGQLVNPGGTLSSDSAITLQGVALDNQSGTIQTHGDLSIDTAGQTLNNAGGKLIAQGDATITAGTFANAAGTVFAGGSASVQATSIDTTGGHISGTRQLDVRVTGRLSAGDASLASEGSVSVAASAIDAQRAAIQAGTTVQMTASGALDVSGAAITARGPQAGDIELAGASVTAQGATIAGDAAVTIQSGSTLQASKASIAALKSLTLQADGALTLDGAALKTNEQLVATGSTVGANAAVLSAGGQAQVTATSGMASLAGATLVAGDTVAVTATRGIAASHAAIGAVGDVSLVAGTGDIDAAGVLVQSQGGSIALQGAGVNVAGTTTAAQPSTGLIAAQQVAITASDAVDTSRAVIAAGTRVSIAGQGALANRGGQIIAGAQATLSGASLDNDGGIIDANGAIDIAASQGVVSNNQGRITTRDVLTMTGPAGGALSALTNRGGTINSTGALSLNLRDFDNAGGNVTALASLTISAGAVDNTAGTLASQGDVAVNTVGGAFQGAGSNVFSQQGKISVTAGATNLAGANVLAQGDLTLTATQLDAKGATLSANTGALRIDAGSSSASLDDARLSAAGAINLIAGAATLSHAAVASGASVTLAVDSLHADAATLDAQTRLIATARTGAFSASAVRITAGTDASLTAAQGVTLDHGSVSAQTIAIDAGSGALDNTGGQLLASGSAAALSLHSQGVANDGGQILSNGALALDAGSGSLGNAGGVISAVDSADIRATGLNNQAGLIAANGDLSVNAAQTDASTATDNSGGVIRSAQASVQLSTGELHNAGAGGAGQIVAATQLAVTARGAINNTGAQIAAGGDLNVSSSGNVTNADGTLQAAGALALASNGLDNQRGVVVANGDVLVNAASTNAMTATINSGGAIASRQGSLALATGQLQNARASGAGTITAFADTTVTAAGAIDNTVAQIAAGRNLSVLSSGNIANAGGTLQAAGSLALASNGLDNERGAVVANGAVHVNAAVSHAGTATLNGGGTIVSAQDSVVLASGDLRNAGASGAGSVTALLDTTVTAAGDIDNTGAQITSGRNLQLAASGALTNTGGTLQAVGTANLRSNGLDNRGGAVVANGALVVNAAATQALTATENTGGAIQSTQASVALTTGALINSRAAIGDAGSVIAAAGDLSIAATGAVDNTRSQISAGRDLAITATGALANDEARLIGMRNASVSAATVTNTQGLIGANGNTSVAAGAGGITNTQGAVKARGDLSVQSQGIVANGSGTLQAGGQLSASGTAWTNDQGSISAQAGSVTLAGTSYSGQNATVIAGGALSLDTHGGALAASGANFSSQGAMTLAAGSGAAQLGDATLVSGAALNITAGSLQADRANVQSAGNLTATSRGSLQATDSTWVAGQSATLSAAGAVTLQDASLFGNTSVSVRGKSVDASRASIESPGDVTVVASNGALNIAGATLTAGRDLVATGTGAGSTAGAQALAGRDLTLGNGAAFDFAASDLQYQFGRDLTVHAQGISTAGQDISARNLTLDAGSGLLNNAGGTLQATGNLSATGRGLNNTGGTIAANGQVTADAGSGTLANASGRIVSIQGSANIGGAVIDNAGGTLGAAVDLTIAGGSLNNGGNSIVAGRNLTATLTGGVNNAAGQLVANTGAARITANGIDNSNGTISGATAMTANAGSGTLVNTGGLVAGAQVSIAGDVNNAAGVISGSSSVTMTTRALNNDAGVIEAGAGGIRIDTQGHTLTNTNTNTNSGSTRGIVSQGAIAITAGALNNQAGYIGASGSLSVTTTADVNNQSGTLLGLTGVAIDAGSATVDNRAGAIKSGADLAITAGTLNNAGAGSTVFAGRDLTITASSIDNSGTKDAQYDSGFLAGRNATIAAATIDNTAGAIVGLGDVVVHASSTLNNTGGQIAGNTVSIDTQQLVNTGGRADAQTMLRMDAPIFSADGVLASNGGMQLALQGDQTNTGTLSANGSLSVSTTGSITNQGHISAQGALSLTATGIDNQAGAVIDAPTSVTLDAGTGSIDNAGLINATSGATTIQSATLNNTGRIYGDSVGINAGTTNNTMDASGAGAVIASRAGDVSIRGNLNNTDGGLVLSLADIAVSGRTRNDGSILNASGDIRFGGSLSNTNSNFATGTQTRTQTFSPGTLYITPSDSTTRYAASALGWNGDTGGHWVLPSTTYPFAVFGANPISAAVLPNCTNTDGGITCGDPIYVYTPGDPIWAKFGIASPANLTAPSMPAGQSTCLTPVGSGQDISFAPDMSGECGTYWNALSAYNAAVADRYAQLDGGISAFNGDVVSRQLIDWYETTITSKNITETVVTASQPGQVLAGGDIYTAGGVNDKSIVAAGGNVQITYSQPAAEGTRTTSETGTIVFNHRVWHGGFSDSYSRDVSAPQPIADAPVTDKIELSITPPVNNLPAVGNSTPAAGASASVPGSIGASASTTRSGTAATITGQLASATTTSSSGDAVNVDAQTAQAAGTAGGPAAVQTSGAGTIAAEAVSKVTSSGGPAVTASSIAAVSASTGSDPQGATQANIAVQLAADVDAPLRGSVIAAQVRQGQAQAITALQTSFKQQAAITPQAPLAVTVRAVTAPASVKAAGYTTVTATGAVRAPNSQLFHLDTQPGAHYLVETDPAFTNYRQWASSAYMLTQLGLDPERQLKLYGDGFAEQRLVDDEILALTGRRFLSGYGSTEEEYQALMDAGVMYARQYQLTPGVALSAEQMAALTTDIVWLQAQTVVLPDGSTTQALVPVVYLRRPTTGDIAPTGTLTSGSNVYLRSTGDIANGGTIYADGDAAAGDGKLTIDGANIANTGTLAGNAIAVNAAGTIDNTGGVIQGLGTGSSVSLDARDIILRTTTQTSVASVEGPNGTSTGTRTNVDRVATVTADSVSLAALNNITLTGAVVKATDDLSLSAGDQIVADTVKESYTLDVPLGGAGGTSFGRTGYVSQASTTNFGTQLAAGGNAIVVANGAVNLAGASVDAGAAGLIKGSNVTIQAAIDKVSADQQGVNKSGYERVAQRDETLSGGIVKAQSELAIIATNGDIKAQGAQITSANGRASLIATNDVNLSALTTQHSTAYDYATKSSGLLSSSSTQRDTSSQTTQAEGSTVSGVTTGIVAARDLNVTGSTVVSDTQTLLSAGRDVNITATTERQTSTSFAQESKSGLGALGGLSYGTRQQSTATTTTATRATVSNVGSLSGDVVIAAGQTYNQVGSNVVAPKGDIDIAAKTVNITEARETNTSQTEQQFKQSGISVSVSNPIVNALETGGEMARAASRTDDARAQALAAATGGLALYNAVNAVAQNPSAATSVGVNISVGVQKSQSQTNAQTNTAAGSTVSAGGNVTIAATGAGTDSNILVRGSNITAGNVAALAADGQVNLLAAQNTSEQHSTNSYSAASVGVGVNFGGQAGVSINANANKASGSSDGSDVTWTNTHVTGGNMLSIASGGDTNIKGAVVAGNTVQADVGGNLVIESLQDTGTYTSRQKSAGAGVSVCIPPLCYGSSSLSVNAAKVNATGDFASVGEQSGIQAGDGGYQVDVKGVTTLKGGVIASTSKAIAEGNNSLTTAALVTSDIQNRDDYSASGYSVGATFSGKLGDQSTAKTSEQIAAANTPSKPAGSAGIGSASGSQSSTTQSGISGGVITITDNAKQVELTGNSATQTIAPTNRDVSTDTDTTGALTKTWNGDQLTSDVQAQSQITAAFGQAAASAWGKYANDQLLNAKTQEEAECWGPTGTCRAGGHAVIGALGGGAAGAVGAAAASLSVTQIGAAIQGLGLSDAATQGLTQAIVLGAAGAAGATGATGAAGGGTAAAGAYNEASNNSLALLMQLTQLGARVAQQGIAAVSAEGQILLAQCARSACAAILPAVVIAAVTASKVATTLPSGVDQIPTSGYTPVVPDSNGGTTTSPVTATAGNNSTTKPGTAVAPTGTPASGSGGPVTGDNTTVSPATPGGGGSIIVMNGNGQQETVNLPSLVDPEGATHILNGDRPGSGGHLWPGQPGKTPFPQDWDANKVLGIVSDVATDPASVWVPARGGRFIVQGTREGVDIEVIVEPPSRGGGIVTGYPTNLPRNPR